MMLLRGLGSGLVLCRAMALLWVNDNFGAGRCAVAAVVEMPMLGTGSGRYSGFRRMETVRNGMATSVTAFGCSSGLVAGTVSVMMATGVDFGIVAASCFTS